MDRNRVVTSPDSALAGDLFEKFTSAQTLKGILGHFRQLCQVLQIQPSHFPHFYPKLKAKLRSWKAQALWNKFDKRASHKCYNRGKTCHNTRVLVIGAGPCGLRAAIEAQLLGAKVVVVEKRDRMSRNNVLHLWPFVIHDLRGLGAKKFFGKFCAGAIDHISIRQLQCILLKVALIFGVEIHEGVGFESLAPPPSDQNDKIGWRAVVSPAEHPVSQYEFDVLLGADGKRNTLDGFRRKEFRGKLAIAITANFINRRSEAEARVEEISGVAFIFNQRFFKDLYDTTGIDLENIVYYKDETHYFVMTAKKHSLIDKGVILNDYADTSKLLSADNVDRTALMEYARQAADFSTKYHLPCLEFAVNHYGQPDVAMFDFTSMYAAENACRVEEVYGHRLLITLVGDSLLEPFWPTGSGCARGFLSCLDACWAIRSWSLGAHPLQVVAERESIYRLLAQTTPENLHRDLQLYTLDPHTRYPNLNINGVLPVQVKGLYSTDDPVSLENFLKAPIIVHVDTPKRKKRRDMQVHPETLLRWLQKQVLLYDDISIDDMSSSFKDGMALCAIVHRYRPHLIDYTSLDRSNAVHNNQLAFDILEKEFFIPPVMTGKEMAECEVPDKLALLSYLSQVYDAFRGEIPFIKHQKHEDMEEEKEEMAKLHQIRIKRMSQMTPSQKASLLGRLAAKQVAAKHLPRKRRSNAAEIFEARRLRNEEFEKARQEKIMRRMFLQQMYINKSTQMLHTNDKSSNLEDDYSLFVYRQNAMDFKDRVKLLEQKLFYPDRDSRSGDGAKRGGKVEDFSSRVKDLEAKLRGALQDKKPKDLLRAIGKIEKSDWNVKELEKKIEENRMSRGVSRRIEKVPKWSKQQFEDKFSVMEKKLLGQEDDNKFAEIDSKLAALDRRIKDGGLEAGPRGSNKVSAMAAQLVTSLHPQAEPRPQPPPRAAPNGLTAVGGGGSETCHFCLKRVYLMERLSAEGKFFHRGCFKCQHCFTTLRLGNYAYDREGRYGNKFFCVQHFGLPSISMRRPSHKVETPKTPRITVPPPQAEEVDKVFESTPERIEFENLESESVEVGEDEWTDRNFGATDDTHSSSSAMSDSSSESEEEEAFAEVLGLDPEETLRLAEDWTRRFQASCTDTSYHHSPDEESGDSKESEEEDMKKARELRKQEVPPEPAHHSQESDTEVASEDYSDSTEDSEPEDNSATEISTDSEFEHDGTTHPIPDIVISDPVQVKRTELEQPKQVQLINKPLNGKVEPQSKDIKLELRKIEDWKPALEKNVNNNNNQDKPKALVNPNKGDYLLNRTQSTEGIASKISLELKKKYLLGPSGNTGSVYKSSSTTTVDTKFKSLIDQISENQKRLNPAPEPSVTMQAILQAADRIRTSPVSLLKQLPEDFKHVCGLKEDRKAEEEERPSSPIHETSIPVPDFPKIVQQEEDVEEEAMESDSLSSSSSTSEDSIEAAAIPSMIPTTLPPKLEIHNSRGELMDASDPDSLAASDWARDETLDLDLSGDNRGQKKLQGRSRRNHVRGTTASIGKDEEFTHVCGKGLLHDVDGLQFMDTGGESCEDDPGVTNTAAIRNSGYIEFVNPGSDEEELPTPLVEVKDFPDEDSRHCTDTTTTSEITTVKNQEKSSSSEMKPFNDEYDKYVEHLTDKITPFPHIKDSNDVKKSQKKLLSSKSSDDNTYEDKQVYSKKDVEVPVTTKASMTSPKTSRKLEQISKERSMQKDIVHEMVMNKLRSEGKSPQEKMRRRSNRSLGTEGSNNSCNSLNNEVSPQKNYHSVMTESSLLNTPRVPLRNETPKSYNGSETSKRISIQSSLDQVEENGLNNEFRTPLSRPRPRSVSVNESGLLGSTPLPMSLPDIHSASRSDAHVIQLRESAKARYKMMSNEELGLSPEEKIFKLRERFNKYLTPGSTPTTSKYKPAAVEEKQRKASNPENRRKSIIQTVSDFFLRKSPSSSSSSAKSPTNPTKLLNFKTSKSKESFTSTSQEPTPPPVPPLPQSYTPSHEDSWSEEESRCGQEEAARKARSTQRFLRQQHNKRLRMAQEMQRQLEEVEVKQRELEARGVHLEKALRSSSLSDQGDRGLLEEWFSLMRERGELRAQEKRLIIRCQELELEDRHSRLQANFKHLVTKPDKTEDDVAVEGRMLKEMLEIVERKEALAQQLRADRDRREEESKDLEAQMKAKGITSLRKNSY